MISDMNSLFRRKPTNIFSNPNLSAQISHRYYVLISQSVNSSQNPQIPLIKSLRTSQISKFRVPSRVFSTQSSTLELQCRKLGFRFDSSRNPQIPLIKPRKTSQISKARVPCRVFSTQSSTLGFQYEKLGFQFDSSRKPQIPIIQPSRTAAQISKFSVPAPNFSSDGLTPDFFPNRAQISVTYVLLSQSIGFPRNRQNLRIQPPWTSQIPNTRVPVRLLSTQPSKFPEYEMPTVTWGVIQGRKEKLVSRVIICDYLKNLGIIPDELEHLELPSTVEVMKERVEFLQKIGLTIDDINEYPLMLGCSVRKNIIPVLGYLEKIGISRSKLGEFVKNYPQVLHASVVVELVPVVRFLRGLDVERQDIPYVLQKYPELLGFKLDGTMSTSVAYLVSIGVSPRDIGPMVTQYPYILGMRVGTTIKPIVDYLVSLGLPKKVLARMFEKRAYILGYDLEETMKLNVDSLISFGIRIEVIPSVIAQYPQILGLPLKAKLSTQQYFFNLKLKIDPEGFARVIEKMPQIVSLNQSVIMKPIEFLRERGISIDDVAKMVVKCPQLVALRIALMKNSFYFFKSEMKRPMQELVEFPEYFTYSLESRIKPRYQRLSSKGINCSLAWFLNCSDQRFEERLRADFIEAESVGPSFCMGGKLQMPVSEIVSEEDEDESEDEILYRRTVSL